MKFTKYLLTLGLFLFGFLAHSEDTKLCKGYLVCPGAKLIQCWSEGVECRVIRKPDTLICEAWGSDGTYSRYKVQCENSLMNEEDAFSEDEPFFINREK